jgi:hypothetical protein
MCDVGPVLWPHATPRIYAITLHSRPCALHCALALVSRLWSLGSQTALWHSDLDSTHRCAFSVLSSLCYCTVLSTVLSTPCSTSVIPHCARQCALTLCSHIVLDTVCSGALLSIVVTGVLSTMRSGTVLASVLSHCSLLLPVCSHIELSTVLSAPCHRLCTLCSWLWSLAFLSTLLSPLCPRLLCPQHWSALNSALLSLCSRLCTLNCARHSLLYFRHSSLYPGLRLSPLHSHQVPCSSTPLCSLPAAPTQSLVSCTCPLTAAVNATGAVRHASVSVRHAFIQ